MLFLLILILLAPAVFSVILYEKFSGVTLSTIDRIGMMLIFGFLINMAVYAVMWLRGLNHISWALDGTSNFNQIQFCFKYMGLSLMFASALPFVFSIIKIGKRK